MRCRCPSVRSAGQCSTAWASSKRECRAWLSHSAYIAIRMSPADVPETFRDNGLTRLRIDAGKRHAFRVAVRAGLSPGGFPGSKGEMHETKAMDADRRGGVRDGLD